MAKFIFVTGGVTSSLGKGILAASLAKLLQSRGLRVTIQKFDPYINIDPGTMNPYEHGECYVTEDGAETDLDLGRQFLKCQILHRVSVQRLRDDNRIPSGEIGSHLQRQRRIGGVFVMREAHREDAVGKCRAHDGAEIGFLRLQSHCVFEEVGEFVAVGRSNRAADARVEPLGRGELRREPVRRSCVHLDRDAALRGVAVRVRHREPRVIGAGRLENFHRIRDGRELAIFKRPLSVMERRGTRHGVCGKVDRQWSEAIRDAGGGGTRWRAFAGLLQEPRRRSGVSLEK